MLHSWGCHSKGCTLTLDTLLSRATWQTLYQNPAFDTRFFVSNPGDLWRPLIQHENATYGDLIVLSDLEESKYVATHIKPLEFHKHIANSGLSWDYLAKLDDDSFLDAGTFYREFLLPDFQKAEQSQTPSRMMVARRLKRPTYPAPGGQFYSISWELVDLISRLYTESDIEGETEDVLVGRLLFEANEPFDWVELNDTRAFDIVEDLHQVGKMAINPHKMKDDETYLKVAQMYDSDGYRGERR